MNKCTCSKGMLIGAGAGLVFSALGTLLGPSPLAIIAMPVVAPSYALASVIPGLSGILENGISGGGWEARLAFIGFTTALGAIIGFVIHALVAKGKTRASEEHKMEDEQDEQ